MTTQSYYHVLLRMNTTTHYWANYTKDQIVGELLVPFVTKQIVRVHYEGSPALLNLSSALYLKVFKSPERLEEEKLKETRQLEPLGLEECTEELIDEIRLEKAHETAKSVIQKLFLPVKKQIFVIMKFEERFLDSAYKGVMRPLGEEFGYRVIRIDDIQDSGIITEQILDSIVESEIILADLSCERPNCYYETGFAHAIGKELILTIREGDPKHFDLAGYRFIEWLTEDELRTALRARFESITSRQNR